MIFLYSDSSLSHVITLCVFGYSEIKYMKVPKGVNAFDFCAKANIIATGGVDKIVRVWHPHIFTRPTGKHLVKLSK